MKRIILSACLVAVVGSWGSQFAIAQTTMANYTAYPPFLSKAVPPAVMIMMTKDHRLFFKGYNDLVDLDGSINSVTGLPNTPSGTTTGIETGYADYIDYVGYFDPKKCYTYSSPSDNIFASTGWFSPSGAAGNSASPATTYGHSCAGTTWSGNFLNWATMARIDLIRKVLYGGKRIEDLPGASTTPKSGNNGSTILGRTITPRDAHSWAKVYVGADIAQFVPSAFTSSNAITICNTNSASSETVGMMMVLAGSFPDADSTESVQCSAGAGIFVAADVKRIYRVAVKVCDWTVGLESNCDTYKDDVTPNSKYTFKPQGLLQRMAVNTNGSDGTKDDTVTMRFGLITGSYNKNFSGGVLRSKIADLYGQEINQKTGQILGTSKVIRTIDMMRVVGYNFSGNNYNTSPVGADGTCQVNGDVPAEGNCKSWGEPFAEMFYEAVRYFKGVAATSTTAEFYQTGSGGVDNGIQSWAMGDGSFTQTGFPVETKDAYGDPYGGTPPVCEYCSKSFVLMFGDSFPSHDSDQVPGAYSWTSNPTPVTLAAPDSTMSLGTLLTASNMNALEGLSGTANVFIGELGGGGSASICSAKSTTTFLNLRGLCPEEPNKFGTYYLPMLAHYAKTTDLRGVLGLDTGNTTKQNITTYAVVASAPVPILEFTVGGNKVQITPAFHSGCPERTGLAPATDPKKYWGCFVWGGQQSNNGVGLGGWQTDASGASPGAASTGGNKGQLIAVDICANDADWTLESGAPNNYTSCYEIQWDDSTYGGDFDLDLRYRLYMKTTTTQITVKTKPIYASSGNGNWAGFYINGVSAAGHDVKSFGPQTRTGILTGNGEYYDIRCGNNIPKHDGSSNYGSGGTTECQGYNPNGNWSTQGSAPYTNQWTERTFTVSGGTASLLKDPLWYASKYGGFKDSDKLDSSGNPTPGYNQPDKAAEWDADGNGVPDTYFLAQNPLQLEGKLATAFAAILNQTSSGTAASVLSSSTSGEGATYQTYFFPTQFEAEREIKYTGYVHGLFTDKYGNLREDTNQDGRLVLTEDRIVVTRYDAVKDRLVVDFYVDVDGNGKAKPTRDVILPLDLINDTAFCDDAPHECDKSISDIKPIWEGGRSLAFRSAGSRNIYTWVDINGDGLVDHNATYTAELIPFDTVTANKNKIAPYLNLAGAPAAFSTDNLIDFIRGTAISGLRDRTLTVKNASGIGVPSVWKLGDAVYSTPVVVAAPRERYDVLYGDKTYRDFYQKYKSRRQVAYLGANDGMMHAFNVGVYNPGDAPSATFGDAKIEHGWFTAGPAAPATNGYPTLGRGDELWAFIPQELLPHLRWLADPAYTHVYYVDLKPKITDVRIFSDDTDHPGGWGTVLIGGFRMGGSCGNCTPGSAGQGAPMTVSANFDYDLLTADTSRTFFSAYFVLDITNPEKPPTLLWSFSDTNLGFTMSYPTITRVRPMGGDKTKSNDEKWLMVVGSGATSYDAGVGQAGRMFAVDMLLRRTSTAAGVVTTFDATGSVTPSQNSFIGDLISFDRDFDYRADAVYGGKVINASPWEGMLIRLTTGCWKGSTPVCNTDPALWGVSSGGTAPAPTRAPSEIMYQYLDPGSPTSTPAIPPATKAMGPVPTSLAVTLDDSGHTWLFAGTGRYYTQLSGSGDKIDTSPQLLVGLKDSAMQGGGGCDETSLIDCRIDGTVANELIDMTKSVVCQLGTGTCTGSASNPQVTNVTGLAADGSYASLISLVQSKKGWFSKLTVPATGPSERSIANPVLLGGIIYFPAFTPSGDVCVAAGASNLYGLYYLTGGAYSSPVVFGLDGTTANIKRSISQGEGLATTVALHLGAQGDGSTGTGSLTGIKACSQSSTGAINCANTGSASSVASRYISWINQRD